MFCSAVYLSFLYFFIVQSGKCKSVLSHSDCLDMAFPFGVGFPWKNQGKQVIYIKSEVNAPSGCYYDKSKKWIVYNRYRTAIDCTANKYCVCN